MTTNKPEVVGLEVSAHGSSPLIRLSDYETLQAECEKLRKLLSAAANYATRMEPMSAKLLSAIDAATQETSRDD